MHGSAWWLFESPDLGSYPFTVPPGWVFGLPTVYGVWTAVVVLLYPVCAWYARVKQRSSSRWLSYL